MKKMPCFLGLALLSSSLVFAQAERPPDSIGLFFDTEYTNRCLCSPQVGILPVYLVASNISCPGGLAGWEAMVSLTPESTGLLFLSAMLNGIAIPIFIPPEFQIGLGVPMAWAPDLLLATLSFYVTAPTPAGFLVHPIVHAQSIPGECCYADGADPGHLVPFVPPVAWDLPAAYMDDSFCCGGIAAETRSWGQIKGMFR